MKINRFFQNPALDAEQERRFMDMMEKRCWKYFLPVGSSIIVFQIYNIFYALQYTGFQLNTRGSRVYMTLYLILLTVVAAAFLLRKTVLSRSKEKSRLCLLLYQWFGLILLLWAACVTVYDQRVSDNLNVYTVAALGIAVLVYMKPAFSIPCFWRRSWWSWRECLDFSREGCWSIMASI